MDQNDVTAEALAVAQALRNLGPREREEMTVAAFEAALAALPEAERLAVRRSAEALTGRVRGVGDRMALSIVGAIGVFWAGRP